ncbi:glycosyl transferase 2 family protein [Lyngbya aestuarii BL J]|uniref:Glycosyl transferase 2 family protein n=1 Tax=Lyngbya aestuarii BL J TaxID=1348334 RepID=U7QS45_9CYAN|nr:glycosyl transferase 2 family protein [Lyngbya aestuarii BL J]
MIEEKKKQKITIKGSMINNCSDPKPTISVIIPVYNGGEKFQRCLQSLAKTSLNADEVIVVADGDTDGSWLLAENFGAKVIRLPKAGGPARARNLGAEAAKGDILFFIDADVEIYPDTIEKVVNVFTNEPDLSALIGSYDDTPGAENFLSQYRNLFHHYTHQISQEEASTFWGACGAVRKEVFLHVGGFDEKYRLPCIEDIELGYRLKKAGYSIGLRKGILVKHLKEWRPISMVKADFFCRALPWTALILRDRQLNNDLNLQYSNRMSVVLVYAKIGALLATPWLSQTSIIACIFALAFVILNAPVYQFFHNKRGLFFTLRALPWHWLYYFYSGLAFGIGFVRHWFQVQLTYRKA